MPTNRHSNTIRCPYCKSKIFTGRFEEHLMNAHNFTEGDARKLLSTAAWKPFVEGKPHGPATVDASILRETRAAPTPPPEPVEKSLEQMTQAELIAKLRGEP